MRFVEQKFRGRNHLSFRGSYRTDLMKSVKVKVG